ncbi:MAG: SDR family oxidoreductase [Saccharofermentans sp.]|nr:SDR family oxidoreductase [Saccharofermentans sp.]
MSHILVCGGSRGIGAGIVNKFANNGDNVSYFYKNAPGHESDNVFPIKCDVTSEDDINNGYNEAVTKFGDVDVLVYCSGISLTGLANDFSYEDYHHIMDTNFGGFFLMINKVLPSMVNKKSGNIIAISSMWGQTGASCEALYSATKGAMDAYVKSLAKEVGPSGIRVNAVSPGVIDTDMMSHYSPIEKDNLAEETPLQRIGTPEDVANAVFYLSSNEGSFITGQILGVNGGFLI